MVVTVVETEARGNSEEIIGKDSNDATSILEQESLWKSENTVRLTAKEYAASSGEGKVTKIENNFIICFPTPAPPQYHCNGPPRQCGKEYFYSGKSATSTDERRSYVEKPLRSLEKIENRRERRR